MKIDSILSSSPVKKQEQREVKELLGAMGGDEVERGERVPWDPWSRLLAARQAGLRALADQRSRSSQRCPQKANGSSIGQHRSEK